MISVLMYVYFFGFLAASDAAHSQSAQLWCPTDQMNYTACAGDGVTFNCSTSTPVVRWDVFNANGEQVDVFYSDLTNNTNDTQTSEYFTFTRIGPSDSELTFDAQYDLNGYKVSCTAVNFTTNSTTNETTSSNDTSYCYINIPAMPSAPAITTYSLNGSNITVFWAYSTNPGYCVMTFIVQAVPGNSSFATVSTEVDSSVTNASLTLQQNVAYTITVIASTLNENVTSGMFCIQLSSPSMVTSLMGSYYGSTQNIYATWQAPGYQFCERPSVTSYNVTHNVTDGNAGGSGSGAPMAAMNDTFTLPANQTSYTFEDTVYGNVYFVEVTPSNTFGFGQSDVIFITATTTTTTSTSTSTPAASTSPTESPASSGGLSAGAIAGIVVGIVAVIAIIAIITAIIVYLVCCRGDDDDYKGKPKQYKHDEGTKLRQGTDL